MCARGSLARCRQGRGENKKLCAPSPLFRAGGGYSSAHGRAGKVRCPPPCVRGCGVTRLGAVVQSGVSWLSPLCVRGGSLARCRQGRGESVVGAVCRQKNVCALSPLRARQVRGAVCRQKKCVRPPPSCEAGARGHRLTVVRGKCRRGRGRVVVLLNVALRKCGVLSPLRARVRCNSAWCSGAKWCIVAVHPLCAGGEPFGSRWRGESAVLPALRWWCVPPLCAWQVRAGKILDSRWWGCFPCVRGRGLIGSVRGAGCSSARCGRG